MGLLGCPQVAEESVVGEPDVAYQRIISTSLAGDALVIDLLAEHDLGRIVGLSSRFNRYGTDGHKEKILGASIPKDFSMELLAHVMLYQPDLILASQWSVNNEHRETLRRLGVRLYELEQPMRVEDIYAHVLELGTLLGDSTLQDARSLVHRLREIEERIVQRAQAMHSDKPRSVTAMDINHLGRAAVDGSNFAIVMELLGFVNIGAQLEGRRSQVIYRLAMSN